jgi:hypothetical protein
MCISVNYLHVEVGTSRGEYVALGVNVPTDIHVHGSSDGAHSVTLHDSLEGIHHHEECFVSIGGGGEQRKATVKVIFRFR